MMPKAWLIKGKIDKLNLFKIKSLLYKVPFQKIEGQIISWEKIFLNHTSNKAILYVNNCHIQQLYNNESN